MRGKRTYLLALLLMLVFAGVLSADLAWRDGRQTYVTAQLERGKLITTITATGTLNAVVTVRVGSQLSGQIGELLVDFNAEVKKGQPLAALDPATYTARVHEAEAALEVAEATGSVREAAVEKARADLANARTGIALADARVANAAAERAAAEREMTRKRVLRQRGAMAESEVDDALARYESASALLRAAEAERAIQDTAVLAAAAGLRMAEADLRNASAAVKARRAGLRQAEVDLKRTMIRAPIDGVVIGRNVDRGQTVAATLEAPTLFTIAQDLRRMEVHAKIDEADIGQIQLGQRATFTVNAHSGRIFAGRLAQIRKAPEVIQNVVTYTVVLSVENPDFALLPGMTAIVQIVVEQVDDVLKLPNAALRFEPPDGPVPEAPARTAVAAGAPASGGTPAVVWTVGADGRPVPIRVGLGRSDVSATEVVAGPLRAGQEVIVAAVSTDGGAALFGIRLGL